MSTSLIPPSLPSNDYQPSTLEEEEAHVQRVEELYQKVVEESAAAQERQQQAVEAAKRARQQRERFRWIAPTALILALIILLLVIYFSTMQDGASLAGRLIDGALNLATELIGVIVTLLLIEWRLQRLERDEKQKKSMAYHATKISCDYLDMEYRTDKLLREASEQFQQRKQEQSSRKSQSV